MIQSQSRGSLFPRGTFFNDMRTRLAIEIREWRNDQIKPNHVSCTAVQPIVFVTVGENSPQI